MVVPSLASRGRAGSPAAARSTAEEFALSSCLKLPDSFGNISRGEAFCAYISVLNHHETRPLLRVAISAKLQAPSSKRAVELADCRLQRGAKALPAQHLATPALHGCYVSLFRSKEKQADAPSPRPGPPRPRPPARRKTDARGRRRAAPPRAPPPAAPRA